MNPIMTDAMSTNCKAVILVGGPVTGTRFRPLSLEIPKPLFPIAGYPMIYHHIKAMRAIKNLSEVILLGFYEPSNFEPFIENCSKTLDVPIRYLQESTQMGTAGGLHRYGDVILQGNPEAIFILHGDIGCEFPLQEMLDSFKSIKKDILILSKNVGEEDALRYGQMVIDPYTHEVLHYAEKHPTKMSPHINCGVYLISPNVFKIINNIYDDFHRGKRYAPYLDDLNLEKIRLEQDVIMPNTGKGMIFAFETNSFWCQIKEPKEGLACSAMTLDYLKSSDPSFQAQPTTVTHTKPITLVGANFIHPSARISPQAKIGPHVTVGAGVEIGAGARLKECIILDDVVVKDHAVIRNAIVGWSSNVGYWTRVQGTPEKPCIFGASVTADSEIIVSSSIVLPHKGLSKSCNNEIIL